MSAKVQTTPTTPLVRVATTRSSKRKLAELTTEQQEERFEHDLKPMTTQEIEEKLRFAYKCIKDGTAEWEEM